MNLYFCLDDIIKHTKMGLPSQLHALLHGEDDAYILVNKENNNKLPDRLGALVIPKDEIQKMERDSYKNIVNFKIKITHLSVTRDDKIWHQFLDKDSEDLGKYIAATELEEFREWKHWFPKESKLLSPLERLRLVKTTTTEVSVNSRKIFVKADSKLIKKIRLKDQGVDVVQPYLDPASPHFSERALLVHKINIRKSEFSGLSHRKIVYQIMCDEGYDYELNDDVVSHFAYVTSCDKNKQTKMKKKVEIKV